MSAGAARDNGRGLFVQPGWEVPTPPRFNGLRIGYRLAIFFLLVSGVYWVFWRSSYALFAPHLEPLRVVTPTGAATSAGPVSLGVMVRNKGLSWGAAFVVAALGDGVEVEGPTVEIPARDSAFIPVEVSISPGDNTLSLVLFDGWKGVRRIYTYRGLHIPVPFRELDEAAMAVDESVVQGDTLYVAFEWSNPGRTPETVTPVIVFRQDAGAGAKPVEGPATRLEPGQASTVRFPVDTWDLEPGTYAAQLNVMSATGQRIGFGSYPRPVTVAAR